MLMSMAFVHGRCFRVIHVEMICMGIVALCQSVLLERCVRGDSFYFLPFPMIPMMPPCKSNSDQRIIRTLAMC